MSACPQQQTFVRACRLPLGLSPWLNSRCHSRGGSMLHLGENGLHRNMKLGFKVSEKRCVMGEVAGTDPLAFTQRSQSCAHHCLGHERTRRPRRRTFDARSSPQSQHSATQTATPLCAKLRRKRRRRARIWRSAATACLATTAPQSYFSETGRLSR